MRPKIREGVQEVDFGDELLVSVVQDGRLYVHYLNPQASVVYRLCDGSGTVPELTADIADFYGLPARSIEEQVRSIVQIFRHSGMLTWNPVKRRGPGPDEDGEHDRDHDHGHGHAEADHDERRLIRMEVPRSD